MRHVHFSAQFHGLGFVSSGKKTAESTKKVDTFWIKQSLVSQLDFPSTTPNLLTKKKNFNFTHH